MINYCDIKQPLFRVHLMDLHNYNVGVVVGLCDFYKYS